MFASVYCGGWFKEVAPQNAFFKERETALNLACFETHETALNLACFLCMGLDIFLRMSEKVCNKIV